MASEAVKLPVIEFYCEDLKPETPTWNSVRIGVRTALEEFGCFIALYDQIPIELRKAIFESSEELYDVPVENKARHCSQSIFQGYVRKPASETFVVDQLSLPENFERFTDRMWPQGNSKFRETIQSYSEKLSELDKIVRRMVLESLGLEKYMDEHMKYSDIQIRFTKYKGCQSNEKLALRALILGILAQNETMGLEILTRHGQWIEINFPPNSFLVLAGDLFHAWTNGRVYAPFYRVNLIGNDHTGYSVGLFSHKKPGCIVKPPEEVVDEQHPLLYKPFEAYGLLAFYNTTAGRISESALKAYCGV